MQTKNVIVHAALRYGKYCVSRWTHAGTPIHTHAGTQTRTHATIGYRTVGTREKYSPMFSRDKEIERAVQTKNVLVHVALRYDKYCVSRWTP